MPTRTLTIPAVIIYIALIIGTLYFFDMESSFIADKELVQGTVVDFVSKSRFSTTSGNSITGSSTTSENTQVLVDFEYNDNTYRAEGRSLAILQWQLGETVAVYVAPNNPTESRLARLDEAFFFTLICAFFLAVCTLFAIINFAVYKVRGCPLS